MKHRDGELKTWSQRARGDVSVLHAPMLMKIEQKMDNKKMQKWGSGTDWRPSQ